jgi:anaphase-promoting complex subunit 4
VKDVRFIDDDHLMILATTSHNARLFKLPFRSSSETPTALTYAPWDISSSATQNASSAIRAFELMEDDGSSRYLCHTYPTGSMQPVKLEINGRKGRRVICVLDASLQRYQVLDLDSGATFVNEDDDKDGGGSEDGDLEMSQ